MNSNRGTDGGQAARGERAEPAVGRAFRPSIQGPSFRRSRLAFLTDKGGFPLLMISPALIVLALVIGLPMALFSGIVFAWVALKRGVPGRDKLIVDDRFDVQPFR
jgi:hypothetical protein